MKNIFSIKINTLFLSAILITGTITAIYPSFIIGVNAQSDADYGERDNRYNSHEPEYSKYPDKKYNNYHSYGSEYPPEYLNDRKYNIYELDSYEREPYEKKSYRNNDYQQQEYSSYQQDYKPKYQSYEKDNYKLKKDDNSKSVSISKMNCVNNNVNINGNNAGNISIGSNKVQEYSDGYSYSGREGHGKQGKDIECIINNNNTNIESGSNQTVPPGPPITSLTVNKEIYGCDNVSGRDQTFGQIMDCQTLQNDSPAWISCEDPTISDTRACLLLPEDYFDINVFDDQNNQRTQFQGSAEGTTIENLEPGTYTINEIEYTGNLNQLGEDPTIDQLCRTAGFSDGGSIANRINFISYDICFEYEDEQGNDCSNISLAAGVERTCTVKNYILLGEDDD